MSYIKDKYIDLQNGYKSQKDRLKQINTIVFYTISDMDLLSGGEIMDRLELIRKLSGEQEETLEDDEE